MSARRKILLGPLDWGLGHTTRCIPVIRQLLEHGFEVLAGVEGRPAALLKKEIPQVEQVTLPGYGIQYAKGSGMALRLALQLPHIRRVIRLEHEFLDKMVKDGRVDAVISDNRFGLWSSKIPSIYITHQLTIKTPPALAFAEAVLHRWHASYIRHFNECWIPDMEDDGLSGELAHKRPSPVPAYFIGPLSRFQPATPVPDKKFDLMFIISGPEPQRSFFEDIAMQALTSGRYRALILTGKPETFESRSQGDILEIYSHMDTASMQAAMLASGLIICRPGYSGIMDLATLGCRAAFVPTPGQTEQEYLAHFHAIKKHYFNVRQKQFDLERLINGAKEYKGIKIRPDSSMLKARIDELAARLTRQR